MRKIFILLFASLFLFSSPILAKDAYSITIKINGMPKTQLLLGYYYGDKQYIKDSAMTDLTGKAVFKGAEKLEGGIYLIASADRKLLFDFVVTEQEFLLETDSADYIEKMTIKNSPENVAFFNYSKFTSKAGREAIAAESKMKEAKEKNDTASERKWKEELRKIEMSVVEYRKKTAIENPNVLISKIFKMMQEIDVPPAPRNDKGVITDSMFQYNYYRQHYFDNFDWSDDRLVRTPVFHGRLQNYITKVTPQIPDSIIKAADFVVQQSLKTKEGSKWCIYWITNYYETSQYMGMDAVFVHMVQKYYTNKEVTFWLDETLRYKITDRANTLGYNLLGMKAQNISLPDTAGRYQSLYNVVADYTVVVFWDATCGRCKEEMPKLLELYNEQNKNKKANATKKLDVYALSMTVDTDVWKKYIREHKLPWINVYDPQHESNFRKHYDVYSTPVVYLLGKDKRIIAKRLSIEQVKEFIEKGITE